MSVAVLFIIAKVWKEPRCPSTDERIKKNWGVCVYTCTMEYSSTIKNNVILPLVATWMDFEGIILSEVREGQILYDVTYM